MRLTDIRQSYIIKEENLFGGNKMGNSEKSISSAVIKRLPRYFRYLGVLKANNITRISSKELSEQMMVTASQIRQDLNNFEDSDSRGMVIM